MPQKSERVRTRSEARRKLLAEKLTLHPGDVMRFSTGATINLGDYSSMRVDFGLERALRKGEDAQDMLESLIAFVEEVVDAKIENIKDQVK